MKNDVDWSIETCPDCGERALACTTCNSDQIEDGCTVYCAACGFAIEGRDQIMVQSAMLVLKRWRSA
jgi:transcription elongation factor Elf1